MNRINYDNRFFRSASNSANAEVSEKTVFHYHQKDNIVWATYAGGQIKFGTLIAEILASGELGMRHSHLNQTGEMMTGECRSTPEILPNGRIRLHEKWRWTSGDFSTGESVIEEILN